MAQITIFGLAGTGTSSTGKEIAKRLNYEFISTGNIMRRKAEELGLSIYEFDELCKKDDHYDRQLDLEIKKIGEIKDNFVIESRLAWHFIPTSFKIKLICDFDERIKRVSRRDDLSLEEAKNKTVTREETFLHRNLSKYGIKEFAPNEVFDLVIDTTHTRFGDVVHMVINELHRQHLIHE